MKGTRKLRLLLISLALVVCCSSAVAGAGEPEAQYLVEIAELPGSSQLVSALKAKGIATAVAPKNMWVVDQQSNCAVWIGKNVPLDVLRVVLPEAVKVNPYLKFFHVVGDRGEVPPPKVNNTVHVGGNIEAALVKKLNQIEPKELLATLNQVQTLEQFHSYLHEKNIPRPSNASGTSPG